MRYRITFKKNNEAIYTSAIDVHQIWERALRRAHLAVKYSEGFHPQPKIQVAVPLPLGFKGANEIIDVWFLTDYASKDVLNRLSNALPDGFEVSSIEEIPDSQKALTGRVESAIYSVKIRDHHLTKPTLEKKIEELLEKETIICQRNKKRYDLRPLIYSLKVDEGEDIFLNLMMNLKATSGASGRPDEILKELGINPAVCEIERLQLFFRE